MFYVCELYASGIISKVRVIVVVRRRLVGLGSYHSKLSGFLGDLIVGLLGLYRDLLSNYLRALCLFFQVLRIGAFGANIGFLRS